METITLWELYQALSEMVWKGNAAHDSPMIGDNGGDIFTLDGIRRVDGRVVLQISSYVEDNEETES